MECLQTLEGFNALKGSGTPAGESHRSRQRNLPCDVASSLERNAMDVAALARYARQGPALHDWLAGEAQAGDRYAVLGDFNRDLQAESDALSNHAPPGGLWAPLQEA